MKLDNFYNRAIQAYEKAEGGLSITQAAWLHAVLKTTLYNRIKNRRDQVSYIVLKQRLTPEEEKSLQSWVLQLQSWGFLPQIAQLRKMAKELLRGKQDFKELGKNWSGKISSPALCTTVEIQPYA